MSASGVFWPVFIGAAFPATHFVIELCETSISTKKSGEIYKPDVSFGPVFTPVPCLTRSHCGCQPCCTLSQ